ncbi:DinB family protein [Pedobacter aquatilis]|uniref:DinB family protein n=1 Tax=Pedobacter aquatilis TaxID=351343 RepID=UPI0025B30A37|nr:DinB family protein [Pedobacter aquatilis]MDN3588867.1 DinB family protein [Pedobacter aquatilis]
MKKKPIVEKLYGLIVLYEMHTDFLKRALDGIAEEDVQKRLNTNANHIAWITGSIVDGRYYLAKSFGLAIKSSTLELFKDNHSIIDDAKYPSIAEFLDDWDNVSLKLQEALTNAVDEKLNERIEMPGMEMTLFDMISFTIYREANCIGQIALWRRLLGYKGMNYM